MADIGGGWKEFFTPEKKTDRGAGPAAAGGGGGASNHAATRRSGGGGGGGGAVAAGGGFMSELAGAMNRRTKQRPRVLHRPPASARIGAAIPAFTVKPRPAGLGDSGGGGGGVQSRGPPPVPATVPPPVPAQGPPPVRCRRAAFVRALHARGSGGGGQQPGNGADAGLTTDQRLAAIERKLDRILAHLGLS
ncbi:hypothetical protein JKP88DRAFT_351227 [Tribonema minus]|uniref:Uncharacterized protein n=1 Tax=Tribonema minus TaxID=303371 RepID=A0A835YIB7_9STRA|nr:hypothetical protein JKP88DRAFT_351227 [Tribonema minus]